MLTLALGCRVPQVSVGCSPPQAGDPLGDGGSVLDFMSVKSYSEASLDMSVLSSLGELCWARPCGLSCGCPHGTVA